MEFDNACIPGPLLWSSPFIRWQGSTADVSSLDLAVQVTRDALQARGYDAAEVAQLVYGTTVPQAGSFFAGPLVAARIGLPGIGGPTISQACATSVACIVQAAAACQLSGGEAQLVVTADRVSNGPLMIYPRSHAMGGSPATEHWVLDNFACDPWTGESMIATAEATAREGGFTRGQCDEVTLLRHGQYQQALANDRRNAQPLRGQRPLVQPRHGLSAGADECLRLQPDLRASARPDRHARHRRTGARAAGARRGAGALHRVRRRRHGCGGGALGRVIRCAARSRGGGPAHDVDFVHESPSHRRQPPQRAAQ